MPEPLAFRTGTLGAVEAEQVGRRGFEHHPIKLESVGEGRDFSMSVASQPVQLASAMPFVKGSIDRVGQSLHEFLTFIGTGEGQSIDDQVQFPGAGRGVLLFSESFQKV